MVFRIGLENELEGRSLAWALDLPGCFAYGPDGQSAVMAMGKAIPDFIAWLARHDIPLWFNASAVDIRLVETQRVYYLDDDYQEAAQGREVTAWFRDDWRPLTAEETARGLAVLSQSRQDLNFVISMLSPDQHTETLPGERRTIDGILNHIATSEWWYLSQMGLSSTTGESLPHAPEERLASVRENLEAALTKLAGKEYVVGKDGEFWSPRKLLRRAVWHERDHVGHIARLAGLVN